MRFEEYRKHDAVGLAALVAKGEVTAGELLDTALARAAEVNPKVNAIVHDLSDRARAQAPAKGPLAGVPFLLKDLGAHYGGAPTSYGSRMFSEAVAPADSALTRLYKAAGLNIFGKTNTPEFGIWPVTEPDLFGPARNPWDLSRTPGGSSGGASAAVAAGIVPAAHASDGGGSIRIPAACCGLFGMKPSRGRVSFSPAGEGWAGASIQHAVTRSVRDSAVLLDIGCVPQPGDPYFLAPPERPYAEEVGRDPGRLRIAVIDTALTPGVTMDPEVVEAVRDAARLCEGLGHSVEAATLGGDHAAMQAAARTILWASVAANVDAELERRGRPLATGDIEPATLDIYRRGKETPAPEYVRAVQTIHAYGRAAAELFERYDVLLLATLGRPAIPVGWLLEEPKETVQRLFSYMPNTQAFNNSGQPAMTVPLAWSSDGLPIGLQFVARTGDEAVLFRLAGQLEQARPWFDRVPPL
ncbi:amidase [Phenylobacterium kunshanense]|uniref:Amidase n=1 Tax=Phenylobacterium kunshanense TaxID=1445034 RepID=A0A328B4H4_9CAUL|nr:amidase [Phenylobacterium kunshanense]RAK62280.1 amidase [Phenylobacterium kunshanense]